MLADNSKIYGVIHYDSNTLQQDLYELDIWSKNWQLPFNAAKYKVMHVGHKNRRLKYTLYDNELETTQAEKDLGVLTDKKLKFHIQTTAALTLYKAMVRPHLE